MDVSALVAVVTFVSCCVSSGVVLGLSQGGVHVGISSSAVPLLSILCTAAAVLVVRKYLVGPLRSANKFLALLSRGASEAAFDDHAVFKHLEETRHLRDLLFSLQHSIRPEEEQILPETSNSSLREQIFTPVDVEIPKGKVTFVFTDIEASSVLWKQHPDDMKAAMRLHNTTIRIVYSRYQGYEVKTIGDAFMLTFDQANNAVRFACDAQLELLNCDWPENILTDNLCAPITRAGQLIYRGMRVRMGMHTGEVAMEIDPVSNRADYFGHTVNTAARIESAGAGGCIVCSSVVIQNINPSMLSCTIVPLGTIELKGVGQRTLHGIIPTSISERGARLSRKKVSSGSSLRENSMKSPSSNHLSVSKGKFYKMLFRDLYSDRLQSDGLIRSIVGRFLSSDELQPLNATVVQIRIGVNFKELHHLLSTVGTLGRRTFGVMLNTATTTVTLVWMCQAHAVQAVSFVASLYSELGLGSGSKLHVGMASGGVMFGITSPGEEKHIITCVGAPVDLSFALAEAAEMLEMTCLVPSTIAAGVPSLTRLLRPIDRWPFHGATQTYAEVNELHIPALANAEKWDILYGMYEDTTWCDASYRAAFDDVQNGDLTKMKEIGKKWPDDMVVRRILQNDGVCQTRAIYLPGQHVATSSSSSSDKENMEEAWKRATAASKSSRTEMVFMEGWAYDVSAFMHTHPGGMEILREHLGKDISDLFRGHGEGRVHDHSAYAADVLRTLRVFRTDNLATNESNMMIVRDTWQQLQSVGLKEIGVLLFKNLFEMHPEYLQLFPWGSTNGVYESQVLAEHGLQVMTAVNKAVTDLSNSHEVAHILHELGRTHIRYGISKHMFDVVGIAFDVTLRAALQERYTPQVRHAWGETIRHIMLMAKDGVADTHEESESAVAADEYRSLYYKRREARTHNTTLFVFHLNGVSSQYFAPGSHVSVRFNGKLSRPYSILNVRNDEIWLLIKLNHGRQSSKELNSLTTDSLVGIRGPLLAEHQYVKGQDLLLVGGATGCVPLLSLARAALKDGGRVWFIACCDTYGDVAFKPELEEFRELGGELNVKFFLTKGRSAPEGVDPIFAPILLSDHVQGFFPPVSQDNHVVICGSPIFNTNVRAVVLSSGYTFTVMGSLSGNVNPSDNLPPVLKSPEQNFLPLPGASAP